MGELPNKSNKLAGKALAMLIILMLSKLLGFLRDVLLAYKFGTSETVDAYSVAISVPGILFAFFASGLNQSYLPFYSRIKDKNRKEGFFSNILLVYIIIAIVATLVSFFLRNQIAVMVAPGFDDLRHEVATSFIGVIVWMFPFYMLYSILSAQLQSTEDFSASYICGFIVVNLVIIASITISNSSNRSLLVVGYVMAYVLSALILGLYFVKKSTIGFKPHRKEVIKDFRDLIVIAIPVGLSFMVNQLNSVTDSIFTSLFNSGITSGLSYANKTQNVFLTLTTTVFMSVVFPRLNNCFAKQKNKEGMSYIRKGLMVSSLLSVPFACFVFFFSNEIVVAIFRHGAFDDTSTYVTAGCLTMYAIGIPFYSLGEIWTRSLTAALKQKRILLITVITVAFNIVADYLFMRLIGYTGLALATSVSGILLSTLLFRDIRRCGLSCIDKTVIIEMVRIIIATAFTTGLTIVINYFIQEGVNAIVRLSVLTVSFMVLYFIFCMVLRVTVLKWLLKNIKGIIKNENKR